MVENFSQFEIIFQPRNLNSAQLIKNKKNKKILFNCSVCKFPFFDDYIIWAKKKIETIFTKYELIFFVK